MPTQKKDPSVRRRANKASTKATLTRVTEETTTSDAYATMTVVQLRAAIDRRNGDRPADQQIPKRGPKALLVELLTAADSPIPLMPDRGHPWHPQTLAWWNDVWTSPMANEWDYSDLHNVFVVALLYDDIWMATSAKARKEALSEYRLQRADLGLSPYSRRRLEWTIETAAEATARGEKRRGNGRVPVPAPQAGAPDPRAHLSSVS